MPNRRQFYLAALMFIISPATCIINVLAGSPAQAEDVKPDKPVSSPPAQMDQSSQDLLDKLLKEGAESPFVSKSGNGKGANFEKVSPDLQ